jgi:hypothetical protein
MKRRTSDGAAEMITTPGGSTIQPIAGGGYRICDPHRHCRRTGNLWEALQLIQWAEAHHQSLDTAAPSPSVSTPPGRGPG